MITQDKSITIRLSSWIDILLLAAFSTLCFANIPFVLRLETLSSGFAGKLSWYPLFMLFVIFLFTKLKYGNGIKHHSSADKVFLAYIILLMVCSLASTISGLVMFPQNYDILLQPDGGTYRLAKIFYFMGFDISNIAILKVRLAIRAIKGSVLSLVFTFIFSYILYYYISMNFGKYYKTLQKGISISLLFIFSYSVVEIFFLSGARWADNTIGIITPFFHSIREYGTWWPPLYWWNQIRSIFAEPSYFGIYLSFALPFLWKRIYDGRLSILTSISIFFITYLAFMTQARTAILITFGEFILFVIFTLLIPNRMIRLKTIYLSAIFLISFYGAVSFENYSPVLKNADISIFSEQHYSADKDTENYFARNVSSVIGKENRSNDSRYSVSLGNVKIGLQHPLLGVGEGLNSAYLPDNINDNTLSHNFEVRNWIRRMYRDGILNAGVPNMGEFVTRFAQNGAVGLVMFVVPWIYIFIRLSLHYLYLLKQKSSYMQVLVCIALLISVIGTFITGLGDNLNILYVPWVSLSFAYAYIFNFKSK